MVTFGPVGDTGQDQEDQPPPVISLPLCLHRPVPAAFPGSSSDITAADEKRGQKIFRGCTIKFQTSKMGGGSLENRPSDRGFFPCATTHKIRELFLTGAKEAEGGRPLEKNSSDRGIVS